jgi:hypothetical protein
VDVSRFLISAPSEFVADTMCGQLVAAGIRPQTIGNSIRPATLAAGRDIYVDDEHLERAREVLREAESVDEAQLIAESEAAASPDPSS